MQLPAPDPLTQVSDLARLSRPVNLLQVDLSKFGRAASMILERASGEKASVEIIRRKEAIETLSKPTYRRTWFGQKFRAPSRNHRGPGAAVDLINYGLIINDKCRAVVRIGNAPWRNKPVIAAVGPDLAEMTAYLMRLWAGGISVNDLTSFIKQVNLRFPHDMMARYPGRPAYRYLLSLDNMAGWLIEDPQGGIFESPPLTGRIYHAAGALYAGVTKSQAQPTRYVHVIKKWLSHFLV